MAELAERDAGMPEPTPEVMEQAYAAVMEGEMPPEVGDPDITARAIQERIRSADSFDEVFKTQSLTPWNELVGEVVTIGGFHLNPSTLDGPSAVYAVVELRREGEDDFKPYSCGGQNVLLQLLKAWEQSWFPFNGTLVAKETGRKRTTYWIEAVQ